jgi:hypothetical protein
MTKLNCKPYNEAEQRRQQEEFMAWAGAVQPELPLDAWKEAVKNLRENKGPEKQWTKI